MSVITTTIYLIIINFAQYFLCPLVQLWEECSTPVSVGMMFIIIVMCKAADVYVDTDTLFLSSPSRVSSDLSV